MQTNTPRVILESKCAVRNFPHGALHTNHSFSSPRTVNHSSFTYISIVKPSATALPSSMTIGCGDRIVIGGSRSKLIKVRRSRIKPGRRFIQNQNAWVHGDAFLPACTKKRRVRYPTETTSAAITQLVTLVWFK